MLSLAKDINIFEVDCSGGFLGIDILSLVLAVNAVNLRISVLRCNAFHSALSPLKAHEIVREFKWTRSRVGGKAITRLSFSSLSVCQANPENNLHDGNLQEEIRTFRLQKCPFIEQNGSTCPCLVTLLKN